MMVSSSCLCSTCQSCYVAIDYGQEEEFCKDQPQTIRTSVNLTKFKLPEGAYEYVLVKN